MRMLGRAKPMLAIACALALCMAQTRARASAQAQTFLVHGVRKSCSDITQLDSVLTSGDRGYFAGWTERDYADALVWSEACKDYGWHIAGKPRVGLLKAQHDRVLPPASGPPAPGPPAAPVAAAIPTNLGPLPAAAATVPGVSRAVLPVNGAAADKADPLLSDEYYNAHFHQESLWVAAQAHLDIGADRGPSSWVSDGSAAQLKNRLTADKIVMFCAHRSPSGATEVRPLLWDWRHCEALEAAAYKRLVVDNEFPAAGRGIVLGCAGLDSYLYLEHCIENLTPNRRP